MLGPDAASKSKMGTLPMPSILLDHIAIALPRIADAPSILVAVLGGVAERIQPSGVFRWASWIYTGGGRIEILGAHGRGRLSSTASCRPTAPVFITSPSRCRTSTRSAGGRQRHGYGIVGRDESDPSWKEAFLHPKQALGIVVQLAEARALRRSRSG